MGFYLSRRIFLLLSDVLTEELAMTSIQLKHILRKFLNLKGITPAALARATKIPPQTLNNWLSGQEPRNLKHLKTVADYFNTTVDHLVYGKTDTKDQKNIEDYSEEINAGIFEVVLRRIKK